MPFALTKRFFVLIGLGIVPLLFAWNAPVITYGVLIYDILLIGIAVLDYRYSRKLPDTLSCRREFGGRFAIGDPTEVTLTIENNSEKDLRIRIKDQYPHALVLDGEREFETAMSGNTHAASTYELTPPRRGRYEFGRAAVRVKSLLGLVWVQSEIGEEESIKVYPNMRRAREMELKALGANAYLAVQRKSLRRGEGREFESMRDYVRGDELRHISWTTTARRAKLTTRQYQIERDQAVVIALDAGRLMTARIDGETKFDTAIHASLALMSAAAKGGDNCGLVVFGRKVRKYLPPQKGIAHIDGILEALHDLEPDLIEPSYSRAFRFISANSKKRSFVVILTDLIDRESSRELIDSLKLLRP
ncbi:MAG: DUF58 domain-containing protein, partial [Pyrinomonadaceae bacterium]|nr:DUF58 domain-containing protein [Pyrinomonadaceae bacterium]